MSEKGSHITPHLCGEEVPRELTTQDFQRELYTWFEERGILGELRAHLRTQMIHVLKDTAIGRSMSGQSKQSASPKIQALNLLLAEYLHSQECYYTLSVLITEIPLLHSLPEFYLPMGGSLLSAKQKKWKFKEKDMWDILETLSIQPNEIGQKIAKSYLEDNNQDPLLVCITRNWHTFDTKIDKSIATINSIDFDPEMENWLENIRKMLQSRHLDESGIMHVLTALNRELKMEREKTKSELKYEYITLRTQLKAESLIIEEKCKIKMEEMEKLLKQQEDQLKGIQSHNPVNERMSEIYNEMCTRERSIVDRENNIKIRELNLVQQQQQINQQKNDLIELQKRIEGQLNKNARNDDHFLQQIQKECKEMKDQIVETQEVILSATKSSQAELQSEKQTTVDDLFHKLQKENTTLQEINMKQHARIHLLSERAKYFMDELEKRENVYATPVVLPAHPLVEFPTESHPAGGGEEAIGVQFTRTRRRRNQSVERIPSRNFNVSSSSSEDDRIREMMLEARQKLSQLEEESKRINEDYERFKNEQTQGKSSSSQPYLGSSVDFHYFKGAKVEKGAGSNYTIQESKNTQIPEGKEKSNEGNQHQSHKTSVKTSKTKKVEVKPNTSVTFNEILDEIDLESSHSPNSSGLLKALYEGNFSGLSFSSLEHSDSNQP